MKNKIVYLFYVLCVVSMLSCKGKHNQEGENQIDTTNTISDTSSIQFRFYLERSGSMVAYDRASTRGEFKTAITNLLNAIPDAYSETNLLYIVNSGVYPYDKTYKEFVQSKDIFRETENLGDPRYTDFTCIFDSLLSRTEDNVVSILVSDLIYSTSDMSFASREKILNEAHDLTASVFKNQSDKDVLIIKLLSDYKGKYYVYNQPNTGIEYNGDRPYYIVIAAKHNDMVRLFKMDKYKEFRNFESLKRYQSYYLFAATDAEAPYYSIHVKNSLNKGTRMKPAKGEGYEVHTVSDLNPNKEGDVYLTIAVDLSMLFMAEELKCDPDNYIIKSKSGYTVDCVLPIGSEAKKTTMDSRYLGTSTHFIVLHTTKDQVKHIDDISIEMPNRLPEWIQESSSSDDRTPNAHNKEFSETTFALYELCSGIYDTYYGTTKVPNYFTLKLSIKK